MELGDLINVTFIDLDPEVISSLARFGWPELKDCEFTVGNILHSGRAGCLVSPANSYGNMDGGVDRDYRERFPGIEDKLLHYIEEHHGGRLRIGSAQLIPTTDIQFPYLLFSPTVEAPGELSSIDNVSRATAAYLTEALKYNFKLEQNGSQEKKIRNLLVPGFGTGFGGLLPEDSAAGVKKGFGYMINSLDRFFSDPLSFFPEDNKRVLY